VKELLKEGESTSARIQKIVDLAQKSTSVWLNIMQIAGPLSERLRNANVDRR